MYLFAKTALFVLVCLVVGATIAALSYLGTTFG
ncbi:MAG: hypothetical protein ACI8UR_000759 [Natronomonas sp.]|jgi:hypothetical protein